MLTPGVVDKRGLVPSSVVNRRDEAGRTPLYVACQYGNIDIVKALLEQDADPEIANRNGYTPLMVAREEKNYPCLLYTSPSPRDGLLSRMPSSA